MSTAFTLHPIGRVASARREAIDDNWGGITSMIVLDPAQIQAEATTGLADVSHIEVLYLFDRVDPATVQIGARHPVATRNGLGWASSRSGPRTGPTGSARAAASC